GGPLRVGAGVHVVVGEVGDLRPDQREPADEPRVAAEDEAGGAGLAAGQERGLEVDEGDVRVLHVVGGRTERPQEVVPVRRLDVDEPGRDGVAGGQQRPGARRVGGHLARGVEETVERQLRYGGRRGRRGRGGRGGSVRGARGAGRGARRDE